MHITIERKHSGLLLSTIHNGQYYKLLCVLCTVREAKQMFRDYVKEQK
jgi:hypothetical protein